MSHLYLAVVGPLEVRHGERLLAFRTRKAAALLLYLAVEERPLTRAHLTTLLWPESDAAHGRMALRSTLAWLRQTLATTTDDRTDHLVITRETLACDLASAISLDLHLVQRVAQAARAVPDTATTEHDTLLHQLEEAAASCRGAFLAGFALDDTPDFDAWVTAQRLACDHALDTIFERLCALHAAHGAAQRAGEVAHRWVALRPLHEGAYACLMRLQAAAGDHVAVLHTYAACSTALATELGVEPSPETRALVERLRTLPTQRYLSPGLPPPTSVEAPLVGRATSYAALAAAYDASLQGVPHLVLIDGEAGIGKTRLARDFLAWAAVQGADTLHGRASESRGLVPYQSWVEALRRRLARENAPDDLLGDIWLSEVSRLLPELRDRYPDLPPPPGEEATTAAHLFEAVAILGQALAARAPLVLFLDDLHWADDATLDLLGYVVRRWREEATRALILLALRPEAIAPRTPLARRLADLGRELPPTRLTLEPLTAAETAELVAALAIEEPAGEESSRHARFVGWLHGETGGQPFYVMETLKALVEQGVLRARIRVGRGWGIDLAAVGDPTALRGVLPAGVQEVIRARLGRLGADADALLSAAATLGGSAPFSSLCRVAGLDDDTGLLALDQALHSRLLREVTLGEDDAWGEAYTLAHDKIRAVIVGDLSAARRHVLHGRALEMLEADGAPPAVLAHHALAADRREAAFRYSVAAGDAALRLFAVRDAIAHYEQARQLYDRLPHRASVDAMGQLYLQLGRAYELSGDLAQARRTYEALGAAARKEAHPALEARALNSLATLAMHDALDMEAAAALLRRAAPLAEAGGDHRGAAEAEWNLAQLAFYTWDAEAVLAHGERAHALAREAALPDLTARSLNVLGYGRMGRGHWAEAEGLFAEAQQWYAAQGDRAMEADCLNQVAHVRFHAARAVVVDIANPWGQVTNAVVLAMGLLDSGAIDQASAIAEEGVRVARRHALTPMLLYGLMRLGAVQRAQGALEDALATHEEAWTLNEQVAPHPFSAMLAAELCADHVAAGQWSSAQTYARRALDAHHYPLRYIDLVRWHVTAALLQAGEVMLAREDVRCLGERIGDSPRYQVAYLRACAEIASYDGDGAQAQRDIDQARSVAENAGLAGVCRDLAAPLLTR